MIEMQTSVAEIINPSDITFSQLEYMAYTGQYEFVYDFFKNLSSERRTAYCSKNILSQTIWGSIKKLQSLKSVHNDSALIEEKIFLIDSLKIFLNYCEKINHYPREIYQSILYATYELIELNELKIAEKFLQNAMRSGVNKFPDMRTQTFNRLATIKALQGDVDSANKFLSAMVEHPYLISEKNKIGELLYNFSQVTLKSRNVSYYKKLLFLGLRYFYTNASDRKKFFDQLKKIYKSSTKLLINRKVSLSNKILFTIHWIYFKISGVQKIETGFISRYIHHLILGIIYLINYVKKAETIHLKKEISEKRYPSILNQSIDSADDIIRSGRSNSENILVTRAMGGIGDLLMMTPALHELKRKHPKREIHLAIPKRYFSVFKHNPDVNLIDIEASSFSHLEYKKWYNFSDCPAARVESRTSPKVKKGRIEIFARAIGIRGYKYFRMSRKPRYFISREENQTAELFWDNFQLNGKKVIGVQIHADETYRDYPMMEKLVERLSKNFNVLVFDALPIKGYNYENVIKVDSYPLREAFAIAGKCDLIIAPDSSFVHFAAAFDLPTIALFGPIDGKLRTKDYPNCTFIDSRKEFGCIPCWRNENIPCKLTGMRISVCMEHITLQSVMNEVQNKLEETYNEKIK